MSSEEEIYEAEIVEDDEATEAEETPVEFGSTPINGDIPTRGELSGMLEEMLGLANSMNFNFGSNGP